jgi:hypothetical protein
MSILPKCQPRRATLDVRQKRSGKLPKRFGYANRRGFLTTCQSKLRETAIITGFIQLFVFIR